MKVYKVIDITYCMCKTFKTKKAAERFLNKTILEYADKGMDIKGLSLEIKDQLKGGE